MGDAVTSKRRKAAAAALALVVGTLVALGAAELLLRVVSPASLSVPVTDLAEFIQFHPRFGWTNRPGAHGRLRFGNEFDNAIRISPKGFRDHDLPYARRPGTFRVLALGDSYTFGQGVEAEEAWPKVLEKRLGPRAEVLNAGVSGWGTAQELLWLEEEGIRYRPDEVVVAFYLNDFYDNAGLPEGDRRPRYARSATGELSVTNLPLGDPPRAWVTRARVLLRAHSLLYRLFARSWDELQKGWIQPVDLTPIRGKEGKARLRLDQRMALPAVELTGALLSELERRSRLAGARFAVVLVPGNWQVRPALRGLGSYAAQTEAYETARSLCAARGLRLLDPFPQLAASEERGVAVYNPTDMHWNAAGHALVAGLLEELLRGDIR
jgi:lysophospholipase L1-like esterase